MGPTHVSLQSSWTACCLGALFCSLFPPAAPAQQIVEPAVGRPALHASTAAALEALPSYSSSSLPNSLPSSLPNSPGFLQVQAAEATARVVGRIYDVNGGLVPGATVTVLDKAGKTVATATSDSEAEFEVTSLPPGAYKVKIAAVGLQTFESPEFTLKAGERYDFPQTALPIATANQTLDVIVTQEMIAEQELADETKQRVLGIFPNFYTSYEWNAAPLNARQKFKVAYKATTDPLIFVTTAIVAGVQQARGTYPEYDDGAAGYGERYAAQYGNAVIGRFIGSAILPSIFHQDPRYFYMGAPSTTGQRFRHAIAFSVTARSDRGHDGHLMPNYSHILGNFIAGYISRTYHPGSDRGIGLAVDNALIGVGGAALQGLTREFVFRRISTHTPQYAKGKPVGVDPVEDKPAAAPASKPSPAATPL